MTKEMRRTHWNSQNAWTSVKMQTGIANPNVAVYGFRNSRIYAQKKSPSKETSTEDCVSCFMKVYKCIYLVFRYETLSTGSYSWQQYQWQE